MVKNLVQLKTMLNSCGCGCVCGCGDGLWWRRLCSLLMAGGLLGCLGVCTFGSYLLWRWCCASLLLQVRNFFEVVVLLEIFVMQCDMLSEIVKVL